MGAWVVMVGDGRGTFRVESTWGSRQEAVRHVENHLQVPYTRDGSIGCLWASQGPQRDDFETEDEYVGAALAGGHLREPVALVFEADVRGGS